MLTVSALANEVQISADTVRHYVKLGLLRPTRHAENNYKLFGKEDIDLVRLILKAKSLGFTLKEIAEIVNSDIQKYSLHARAHEILQQHVVNNHARVKELLVQQRRMELALFHWRDIPQENCDEMSFKELIELLPDKILDE